MKNREYKKLLAVAIMVAMVGSMAGTASLQVNAADSSKNVKVENVKSEDSSETSDDAETSDSSSVKATKNETVYAKIDESGAVKNVTVSDQLKNVTSESTIQDVSNLTDIQNLKGDETFQQMSDALTWDGAGKDIVYSGTADASTLPVGVKITYTLDGKEVKASDLEGKSGHLKIRYDYENLSEEKSGSFVPFLMATGIVADGDIFTNITTTNARVESDGDRNLIIGIALPGVEQQLDSSELDIPDYFEMEADVTDYTAPQSITFGTNEIFNELDTDKLDSLEDLESAMTQLGDASNQLVDGSGQLKDGLDTLLNSSGELVSGVDALASGGSELAGGTGTLSDGLASASDSVKSQLLPGAQQVDAGVAEMSSQITTQLPAFSQGIQSLQMAFSAGTEGNPTLKDGASQLQAALTVTGTGATIKDGTAVLNKNLNATGDGTLQGTAGAVKSGAEALANNAATLNSVVSGMSENYSAYEGNVDSSSTIAELNAVIADLEQAGANTDSLKAIAEQLSTENANRNAAINKYNEYGSQLSKASTVTTNLESNATAIAKGAAGVSGAVQQLGGVATAVDKGVDAAAVGAASLNAGIDTAKAGVDQLSAGTTQLTEKLGTGLSTLKDGTSQVAAGVSKLSSGLGALSVGANKLDAGANTLSTGINTLKASTPTLISGITQLDEGATQLNEGMIEFDENGIDKLTEAFSGDIGGLLDKLNTMLDSSRGYKNFSGISDQMDGSVKFVFVADSEAK